MTGAPLVAERTSMLNPFDLSVESIDRFLNCELVDDPTYSGLELQAFDDPVHGTGLLAFLARRADRRIDVYRQPGLRLDPEGFGIGAGLGEWLETPIDPDRFEITPLGVVVNVGFTDVQGRRIEVRIDDRNGRRRRRGSVLAPVGAAVESPTRLFLVYMRRFDLVRAGRFDPEIRIDGRLASTGRLPADRLHRRRLVKYASDLTVATLNVACRGDPVTAAVPGDPGVELGPDGLAALEAAGGEHRARLDLEPPFPDLGAMADGAAALGTWRLGLDGAPDLIEGTWSATRRGRRADLAMEVTRGWRPSGLPLLMRIVTKILGVFRTWPTTYRWSGTVTVGEIPAMTSRWERTGQERGQSYQRATGGRASDRAR